MNYFSATWRVRLFNGPLLESSAGEVTVRFRSKKVGSLLAYLAMRPGRPCPREEIACALWPDEDDEKVLANRFRFTLASLRKQLEPFGVPFGSVLDVTQSPAVRMREEAVWSDVEEFESAYRKGDRAKAAELLAGPLMPGCYDEWIRSDQVRYELLREELAKDLPQVPTPKAPVRVQAVLDQKLPLYLTRFFGRVGELSEIPDAILENRLVTLSGPGGIGKTRLAVESAKRLSLPCAFVPLAELNDASRIGDSVLGALGISSRTDASASEQIAWILSDRPPTLLILDNAEHLVEGVAKFTLDLLSAVPSLRLLVTSRQRLEVPGEFVLNIHPLGAPELDLDLPLMAAHPSVALFLDRAKSVRPDFVMSPKTGQAVAAICSKLEGVPLAVELAAVRVTAQSPTQIAEALSENILQLKSRQRGLSERHRSLRAALQGSFDLLEPDLQRFYCQLAVFEGGWTAHAARQVTEAEQSENHLEELVIRSLVLVSEKEESARYGFLETVRQFAAENLSEPEHVEASLKHSRFFLELAAQAAEDDIRTLRPLDREEQNLVRVFSRVPIANEDLFWRGLAGALEHAFVRGRHRTALRWIDAHSPNFATIADSALRVRVRNAACQILPDVGRLAETEAMAVAMAQEAQSTGDEAGAIYAQVVQGYVATFSGDLDLALSSHRDALTRARRIGKGTGRLLETCLAHASGTLHDVAHFVGSGSPERLSMLQESEALARELREIVPPFSRRKPLAPLLLATALNFQGRKQEALQSYRESQRYAIELGTTTELMFAFIFESEIAFDLGDPDRAALLFGAFQALQDRMGYSIDRAQKIRGTWISNLETALRSTLGNSTYEALKSQGQTAHPQTLLPSLDPKGVPAQSLRIPAPRDEGTEVEDPDSSGTLERKARPSRRP